VPFDQVPVDDVAAGFAEHDYRRSPVATVDREYRQLFRSPDQQSTLDLHEMGRTWAATTTADQDEGLKELRAVQVGLADLIDDPDL
jgi:hypothetical protein